MRIKVNKLLVDKDNFKLGPINYTFDDGYVYAITGNSACGKTLFLQSILGSIDIEKQMVLYDEFNFYDNEVEIKSSYSYIADRPLFSDKLSVETILNKISKLDSRFDISSCYEYIKKYNIYKHKKIYELSQGERIQFTRTSHGLFALELSIVVVGGFYTATMKYSFIVQVWLFTYFYLC